MKTLKLTVTNLNGLTSRLAADLVAEANKHVSNVTMVVNRDDPLSQADLKSIMNVFTLSVPQGKSFEIDIDGEDEEATYKAFEELVAELHL